VTSPTGTGRLVKNGTPIFFQTISGDFFAAPWRIYIFTRLSTPSVNFSRKFSKSPTLVKFIPVKLRRQFIKRVKPLVTSPCNTCNHSLIDEGSQNCGWQSLELRVIRDFGNSTRIKRNRDLGARFARVREVLRESVEVPQSIFSIFCKRITPTSCNLS
jgi:hypothetical protein